MIGFTAAGQRSCCRSGRVQPQVVIAYLQPGITAGRWQCIGRWRCVLRRHALQAWPLTADRRLAVELQAQASIQYLHVVQAQAWSAGAERCNRSVQRIGFEQDLACGLDWIDQYRLAPALRGFAFVPEAPIGQPVGQHRSIAQRTAKVTVMHAFGALVVSGLQCVRSVDREQGSACQERGANRHQRRIGNVQGNLLLQSTTNHKCTRAARVCQRQPESRQKIQQCEDRCFQGALWRITENLHSRCDGALALLHTIRK